MNYVSPSIFPNNITCVYSTKKYGQVAPFRNEDDKLSDKQKGNIKQNRNNFLNTFNISVEQIIKVKQFHTNKVIIVGSHDSGKGFIAEADGMITKKKSVALRVLTSDCLPIFFYDPVRKVIAVVHAGWKGVYGEIISKTLKKMNDTYKTNSKDVLVWIGPAISGENYGFEKELFDTQAANTYFEDKGGVIWKEDMFYVDLKTVAQKQLQGLGVLQGNIEISEVCTYDDKNLFSYRAGDRTNNMGVLMMSS